MGDAGASGKVCFEREATPSRSVEPLDQKRRLAQAPYRGLDFRNYLVGRVGHAPQ